MKILTAFKVTPDFEALTEADWTAGAAGSVETRYAPRILNCLDESALEMALRLSQSQTAAGATSTLGALSVGGRGLDPFLKTLLAVGYQTAARIHPDTDLDFAPVTVAAIIAGYVRSVGTVDLVVMGCQSGPGDSGTVPFLVAELLKWPCLAQVTEVGSSDSDHLSVARATDEGLVRSRVRLPCVVAVANAEVASLRVPTLSERLATRDVPVQVLEPADVGVDLAGLPARESAVLVGLEPIDRTRQGIVIEGDTLRAKAQTLFDAHLRGQTWL